MNQKLLRQVCYVWNIHNDIKQFGLKISNFSKFSDYITDSVRPVQQISKVSVDIINNIFKTFYLMHYVFPYFFHMLLFIISEIFTNLF